MRQALVLAAAVLLSPTALHLRPSPARSTERAAINDNRTPAGTLLLFEGLPSMDSGFALDAIAAKN